MPDFTRALKLSERVKCVLSLCKPLGSQYRCSVLFVRQILNAYLSMLHLVKYDQSQTCDVIDIDIMMKCQIDSFITAR